MGTGSDARSVQVRAPRGGFRKMLVAVTPSAAAKVKEILAKKGEMGKYLRVQVVGGGCSGLQYKLDFTDAPNQEDQVMEQKGIRVCIDPKSALHLVDTEIDYSDSLMGGGFKLKNPNSTSNCGCGESFSV